MLSQALEVFRCAVSLVLRETVLPVCLIVFFHNAVPGLLGYYRCRGNGKTPGIALYHLPVLDAQSGFESGMGCLLAGIKGINMVSGAGMMNFESTQSIQKLIIDNEICGMTYKFLKGLSRRDEPIALELLRTLIDSNHLLTHPHTLKWMTAEHFYPGKVVDRLTIDEWELKGRKTAGQRAWEEAKALIAVHPGITLDGDRADELEALVSRDLRRFGCDTLPTQV